MAKKASKSAPAKTNTKASTKPVKPAPAVDDLDDLGLDTAPATTAAPAVAEAKPAKGTKAATPVAAPAATAEQPAADGTVWADGFEYIEMPVANIKPNASRTPTEEQIKAMAKSIKQNSLQNGIVVGKDGVVVQGNTRFLAYRDVLKRDTIPARWAINDEGEIIDSTDAAAIGSRLVENFQRNNLSVVDQAREIDLAIKGGYAESTKELASKLGISATYVSRIQSIQTKGTDRLREAIANGNITIEAAGILVSRAKDNAELDAMLDTLIAVSSGKKISADQVNAAHPATSTSGTGSKRGPKPTRSPVDTKASAPEDVGFNAVVVKVEGGYVVRVTVDLPTQAANLARFDLHAAVEREVAKVDMKVFRAAAEEARARLG